MGVQVKNQRATKMQTTITALMHLLLSEKLTSLTPNSGMLCTRYHTTTPDVKRCLEDAQQTAETLG